MSGLQAVAAQLKFPARSVDAPDASAETNAHSQVTSNNIRGKMSKRLSFAKGHFPKLVDCAHFHYEKVDFGTIELQLASAQRDPDWSCSSAKDVVFLVQVSCQGKAWIVRRSYEEFRTLDAHLHQCIYDRRYSQLLPLPALSELSDHDEILTSLLSEYLSRLSMIVDSKLNCGPALTWMEIDNHGNRFLLKEEASLNVPAIAAAHVIKRYTAQASDEISIEVGDILSVIDMPPKEDTSWWRGKHGFQVGFFPSECVELITEKVSQTVSTAKDGDTSGSKPGIVNVTTHSSPSSVSRKHGKLMGFLRTFMKSRPSKQKLKQRGILKERVFGCDLGEHLLNSGSDVPQVLKSCAEFIEKCGIVDGIYRHSGVSSNIQKLRHEFDSENVPDLTKDVYMQDIHCVGSLCKLYFRELPNPLLTYQLYEKFADCMGEMAEDERMVKVHDVIQQLPPPHYRTLEYLMKHLASLASYSDKTNMHIKNLAIVWAPNLLRSMEIEAVGLSGADPFKEVRIQSVVVEFLLSNVEVLFSDSFTSVGRFDTGRRSLSRPKSFVSARLLSLEEAQARTQAPLLLHSVLDLPDERKCGFKERKTAAGSWKSFFAIGKPSASRRKPVRITSLFQPTTSHAGCRMDSVTLRSAKSEESLSSQHSGAGQSKPRLRRPRSSSDGLAHRASPRLPSSRSYDSLLPDDHDNHDEEDEEGIYMLPDFSQDGASSWMAEDVIDFSPTFLEDGLAGTDVTGDGQVSPPAATPPPYRCVNHQNHAHSRSQSQRSVTDDPDSVLNQSEVAARRSLILAAAAPPMQVLCQHSTAHCPPTSPAQSNQPPPERRSFTRKVVNALSPKAPKSPPLDISDPITISVPAKVLEMIGGRAGELQTGLHGLAPTQAPQMISMLLRSCDIQLSESCQQDICSKLGPELRAKGVVLPSQQGPPPPPKNPARLMALALAESANKALRHNVQPAHCPTQASDPDQLYSTVRPLSAWLSEAEGMAGAQGQDAGTLSSETSVSDSGACNSEASGGSSSGRTDPSTSPVYKKRHPQAAAPPSLSRDSLQDETQAVAEKTSPPYTQPLSDPAHPKADSSSLQHQHPFQPSRPKVPPKPLDLLPPRTLLSRGDNYARRSLDASRIRQIVSHSPSPGAALSRAFSERIGSTSDGASRPQRPSLLPATPHDLPENFYYEISVPERLLAPPTYYQHNYQNMQAAFGHLRPTCVEPNFSCPGPAPPHGPQLWSSEATRAWTAAHSHSFSHRHTPPQQPLRHLSSSVRLPATAVPLSVLQQSLHRPQELTTTQLHPYFENGKVCYRNRDIQLPQSSPAVPTGPSPKKQDRPEPIYVNFPFTNPPAARIWLTTDLDRDSQLPSSEEKQHPLHPSPEQESPKGPTSSSFEMQCAGEAGTDREQSHILTGKDIASLLIDKLVEDEGECLGTVSSSSASSSPTMEPANPYPTKPQCRPPPPRQVLRRSLSSGGHYRQVFDVMPSGDQVLKFYRASDYTPVTQGDTPNPYPARPHYQGLQHHGPYRGYPIQHNLDSHHLSSPALFSSPAPRHFSGRPVDLQPQYSLQSVPVLTQYPRQHTRDASYRSPGMQSQRGLSRQGSLPGPNWTVHTEGQTRSYC